MRMAESATSRRAIMGILRPTHRIVRRRRCRNETGVWLSGPLAAMIVAAPGLIRVVRMRVPASIRRVVITGAANIMVVRVACAAQYDHAIRRVTIVTPDEGRAEGAGEDKDDPFAAFQLATLFPECPERLNICHSYTFASMRGAVNYNALPDLE